MLERVWLSSGLRTLLSAVLISAALPPWDLEPVLFVALVPWFDGLRRTQTPAQALLQGLWLAFSVALLVAPWLAVAVHEFLLAPWPVALLALGFFAVFLAQPQFIVFAPLLRWTLGRQTTGASGSGAARSTLTCTVLALAYTGLDVALPRLFDVGLGVGLHAAPNLRQLADLGGVPLLTFLVVLVNLAALQVVSQLIGRERRLALVHVGFVVLLLGSASLYGAWRNESLAAQLDAPARTLRASLVQGSVANPVRLAWASGDDVAAETQLSAYTSLTDGIIADARPVDFVVWPEAAFPGIFQQASSRGQRRRSAKFDRQVLQLGVPLLFGAYDATERDGTRTLLNGLFLINPNYQRPGSLGFVQRYHKHELLPFSETLPGFSAGSWLHGYLPTLGFFGRGPGAAVMQIDPREGDAIRVNPIICSEALHPGYVAQGARMGSELIVNVGSDGWFGSYGEPEFHLAIARFRSIETRLPQVRAANTGISALILPNGEIASRSTLGAAQVLNVEIPIGGADRAAASWFTLGGSAFGWAAGGIALALLLFTAFRERPDR